MYRVWLNSLDDDLKIPSNTKYLKESKIFITYDYTYKEREIRKKILYEMERNQRKMQILNLVMKKRRIDNELYM